MIATCAHGRSMLCLIARSSGKSSGRMVHGITYNLGLSPLHCGLRTLVYFIMDVNLG